MFKKIFVLILTLIFLLESAPVYSSEALSLQSLINEAKEHNPDILAAKKRWEAAVARVPQAKSLDNPNIGLTFEKIPRGTLKLNKVMPEDRMLSISQMFPFFGKLPLKGKIALVESQIAASAYKDKELEIITAVKNAYYELFMNEKERALDQESLNLLEAIAADAEAKYSLNEITQEEVFKIHAEIASLNNNIVNLKAERLAKQARLNTLLNRMPEGVLDTPELNEDISFLADTSSLYQATLLNQPELIIFSYAIEKNKFAERLAKKSVLPDIMAGIVQRGILSGGIGPWDLMLSFSLPFWFWSKQRYEIKEAIANLEEAKASYQAMQNKAFAEVRVLVSKIEIAQNKIRLYKSSLMPILESSIASSLAAFRSGRGDFMMLLDSQRMLVETKMNYYKALVEYNMNLADLERTVGANLK